MENLDITYTCGMIAAREKYFLKEKIFRFCELSAEEAFRMLLECGFGSDAEDVTGVYDYEKLIEAEERKLDSFIREYAPSNAIAAYLLSPRDFHNAKAYIKATYLGESPEKMLVGQGVIFLTTLEKCVVENDFSSLEEYPFLKDACEQATKLLQEEPSGAKIGIVFERALFSHLLSLSKKSSMLRALLTAKVDMTNILTAFRAGEEKMALNAYLPGGKLKESDLKRLFETDEEHAVKAFAGTPYGAFVKTCFAAKAKGLPFTEAERILSSYDGAYFAKRKYDLQRNEPFLFYVYRHKAENANVRIVFACLLAGLSGQEIKRRLRTF